MTWKIVKCNGGHIEGCAREQPDDKEALRVEGT